MRRHRRLVAGCEFFLCMFFSENKPLTLDEQDWSKPVGYHVTLPCSRDQAGYRTFDSAFAVDRNDGTILIKYLHTTLRDQDAYHSR